MFIKISLKCHLYILYTTPDVSAPMGFIGGNLYWLPENGEHWPTHHKSNQSPYKSGLCSFSSDFVWIYPISLIHV